MRIIFFFVVFIIALYSCSGATNQSTRFAGIPATDTTCLKELEEAKSAIEKGKLMYCHVAGGFFYKPLRSAHEMDSLLKKFGISYNEEILSDVVYGDQTDGCYCGFMKEEIDTRFGSTFIDSLLNVADSLYVLNNLHSTFKYTDCDIKPVYPNDHHTHVDDYSEVFQNDVEKRIKYPAGYIKSTGCDSSAFVDINLYVDKSGNAVITGFWFLFDRKANHKYEKYFEKAITEAMRKTGWTPAIVRGRMVNANVSMRLYFK